MRGRNDGKVRSLVLSLLSSHDGYVTAAAGFTAVIPDAVQHANAAAQIRDLSAC